MAQEWNSADWARLKGLFESMLDVEHAARLEFLSGQEVPQELRPVLQDLLQSEREAGSFLNHHPLLMADLDPATLNNSFAEGTVLADRFRIVRFRARGGMGEVYEAEDLELRALVAIKTIRPEIADKPGSLIRFKREVHLARQVTHPNACRIFDIFRHRDSASGDAVFLSMELLSGQTLAERIRQRSCIPEKEALTLLRQVASGLGAVHSAGVLHRDLKPGNIFIETGKTGELRAVITDFGMAWSGDSGSRALQTASGPLAFGTLEFMSPEQIQGKELTPASDLYSLGLVIYQMVTGVRVFGDDTPLLAALRRLNESPPPPSQIDPKLGPQWDAVVERCLNPDPAQRFSSAQQLVEALDGKATVRTRSASRKWPGLATPFQYPRRRILAGGALAACLIAAASLYLYIPGHRKPPVRNHLTLVLADFVNTTGEPAFDNTLNTALAAKLQQTPFLTLMPTLRIRQALRYMGLQPHERLTEAVASQVCQREGGQVVLQGSIADTARGYTLALRAVQCHTGQLVASRQMTVENRDSVLDALDHIADGVRPILGESVDSISKYNVTVSEATTGSLEALTAFVQGNDAWDRKGEAAALPYFESATEIDPNFAMAYARLGTIYGNMGESQRSQEAMLKAFERRDRVSEWERFYIVSHYYGFITGEIEKEMQAYEEWAKAYPHDTAWTINLSVDYGITGQLDKAIALQRRAIQELPGLSPSYGDLAQDYIAAERPDEAREILNEASQLNVQDANTKLAEYELAFYRNDHASMSSLLDSANGTPEFADVLTAQQAATEDRVGKLATGRELASKASQIAAHAGQSEASANFLAGEAVRQAMLGATAAARHLIASTLAIPGAAQGRDVQVLIALASAEAGDLQRARQLMATLSQAHPLDSLIQAYWLPVIRAHVALAEGKPPRAVQALAASGPYDLGIFTPGQCMDAAFVRGQALLADHESAAAAAEFRNILAHRGLVLNCATGALSQLGLARALAQDGDIVASRIAYQDLLALWKDADKDFGLSRQAQTEYRSLH